MNPIQKIAAEMRDPSHERDYRAAVAQWADELAALAAQQPVAYTDESSLKWVREQNEQGNRNAGGIMYGYPHIYTVPLYAAPQRMTVSPEAFKNAAAEYKNYGTQRALNALGIEVN